MKDRKPHLIMTPEEYAALNIDGWHEVCKNVDGFGGIGIRYIAAPKTIPADWPADYQDQFWAQYLNKKAKGSALKALDKIAHCGKTRWADLMAGLERYNLSRDVQRGYVLKPLKWLNGECWTDQDGPRPKDGRNLTFFEIAAGMRE